MLTTIACLMLGPVLTTQNSPKVIEGVARIAGTDRPAARIKLHLFDQSDPASIVVTDDHGRFQIPLKPGHNLPLDGEQEQSCWAEAEGTGRWTLEAIQQPQFHQPPESLWATVNSALAKPVKATWQGGVLQVEYSEPGEVDVLVRGSDGKPLADRRVQVMPDFELGESTHGPADARFTGQLDANGRFQMRWFASVRQLRVMVPGVGFGATGPIVVKNGTTTRIEMPTLAKFGSIAGKLDPKLVGPDFQVHLDPQNHAPVACDATGLFTFDDVPPGRYVVQATKRENGPGFDAAQITLWLAPGQKIEGLMIDALPQLPPEIVAQQKAQEATTLMQFNGKPGVVLWAEGTVKDTSARPLVKADVYLRTAHHGGLRMYEDILATMTDAQGHYSFSGEVHPTTESPVLVAKVKGRPPAVVNAEARTVQNDRPAKVDITVADAGGSASVTVLRDGKPLTNAMVQLEASGSAAILSGFGWARDSGGPEKAAFEKMVEPSSVTDRDGLARFDELIPGLYNVHATDNSQGINRQARRVFAREGVGTAEVNGLAIVAGRETKTIVSIAVPRAADQAEHTVRFQVIRPDGRPVTDENVSFQFGQVGSTHWNTNMKVDDQGIGEHAFTSAGLWNVAVQFRDIPANSFPLAEPFYEAEVLVPVSSAVPINEPIRLVGELHEAGSIRVRLLGLDGQPARGMVELPSPFDRNGPFVSTDANGEVVFEGLSARKYQVQGYIEAPGPPPMSLGGAIPDEAMLQGSFVIVPGAESAVTSGHETFLELKARRVGYLRGKMELAKGQKPADFSVYPFYDMQVLQPSWWYDSITGAFFGGPFLSGPVTLQFMKPMPDGSQRNSGRQEVQIVEGKVTHVDLKPGAIEPDSDTRRNRSTMLGMGGIAINEGTPRVEPPTVFLPDGKTPAFAVQAFLFEPGHAGPIAIGRTDGSGRITWRGFWMSGNPDQHDKTSEVMKPTLIVSLPGQYGPKIVPVEKGKTSRVVLTDSAEVEGRVLLGGRPNDAGSGIRVCAAYQGRGVLDSVLSHQLSPGIDGKFRFKGLTPGRYLVQAARDGIWLSKSVELRLDANQNPPPIVLEIPAPGEAITLEFVDPKGNPFANRVVTLIRPEGPFAATWPPNLRTDAGGRMIFRSLEAGSHTATIEEASERATFAVREASNDIAPRTTEQITLRRAGP
jgi:protocatechuate 3,4-dioxygenase beta subunit